MAKAGLKEMEGSTLGATSFTSSLLDVTYLFIGVTCVAHESPRQLI